MKILIIEDEKIAANKLEAMVRKYDSKISILGVIGSVEESIEWLSENESPDLILLDIHLSDGYSFDIFKKIKLDSFIIFTTAFDQYVLKAFKLNSVDYLLKPIQFEELKSSLDKFKKFYLQEKPTLQTVELESLIRSIQQPVQTYKDRFVVRIGEKIKSLSIEQVAFFYAEQKVVFLRDVEGKKYIIDYTLDQLEGLTNPQQFFRINRKYLAHIDSIDEARPYFNGRLSLKLKMCQDNKIIISREKTHSFKTWMGM